MVLTTQHIHVNKYKLSDFLLCQYRKTGVYTSHCFTPQIILLPGGGHCPLARDRSLHRPLFHSANYPPPGRWTLSISQR